MKKKYKFCAFSALLITTLFSFVLANRAFAYDFDKVEEEYLFQSDDDIVRGFVWGLSPEIIKEYEKGVFLEAPEDGVMFFLDNVLGVRSTISYNFKDDQLSRITFFNEKYYKEPQDRIDDLLALQAYLSDRYGAPVQQSFNWDKGFGKGFPEKWGWAVYIADLDIRILWQTEEMNIFIDLGALEMFEPQMSLTFERLDNGQSIMNPKVENEFLLPSLDGQ